MLVQGQWLKILKPETVKLLAFSEGQKVQAPYYISVQVSFVYCVAHHSTLHLCYFKRLYMRSLDSGDLVG